ncbi:hypothetical protein GCM10018790_55760 [Kitasatospora xanthocidica]|nr:hypothetical protein GCM10018790_55760 [Kitasatospora xanthocidica]
MCALGEVWGTERAIHPRAWVRTVAWRRVLAVRDGERRLREVHDRAATQAAERLLGELGDSDLAELLSVLGSLPEVQQRVFAWTYDGYKPKDIAEILHMNAATVRSALREARNKLKPVVGAGHIKEDAR